MHLEIEKLFICPWGRDNGHLSNNFCFSMNFLSTYTLSWDFGAQLASTKIIFIVSKMASNKRERIIPIKVVSEKYSNKDDSERRPKKRQSEAILKHFKSLEDM